MAVLKLDSKLVSVIAGPSTAGELTLTFRDQESLTTSSVSLPADVIISVDIAASGTIAVAGLSHDQGRLFVMSPPLRDRPMELRAAVDLADMPHQILWDIPRAHFFMLTSRGEIKTAPVDAAGLPVQSQVWTTVRDLAPLAPGAMQNGGSRLGKKDGEVVLRFGPRILQTFDNEGEGFRGVAVTRDVRTEASLEFEGMEHIGKIVRIRTSEQGEVRLVGPLGTVATVQVEPAQAGTWLEVRLPEDLSCGRGYHFESTTTRSHEFFPFIARGQPIATGGLSVKRDLHWNAADARVDRAMLLPAAKVSVQSGTAGEVETIALVSYTGPRDRVATVDAGEATLLQPDRVLLLSQALSAGQTEIMVAAPVPIHSRAPADRVHCQLLLRRRGTDDYFVSSIASVELLPATSATSAQDPRRRDLDRIWEEHSVTSPQPWFAQLCRDFRR